MAAACLVRSARLQSRAARYQKPDNMARRRAQAQAEAAAACPVAAAGLVRCMRPQLGSAAFWRGHHGSGVPAFLRALALIIPAQPLLHAQVRLPGVPMPV